MLFDSACGNIIGLVIALVAIVVAYSKWTYQYWNRRNVPSLEATFPYGNLVNPLRRTEPTGHTLRRLYEEMKSKGWKHGGIYTMLSPTYLVVDLDYLKNIMTKDFQYFVDRSWYHNEKDDPLSAHLFAIGGEKWRNLRTKFTPTFTSGKMKMMFQLLLDCVPNFVNQIEKTQTAIDIKETFGCFTTDIIGSCAFGLDFNTFKEDDSPFRVYGRKMFTPNKLETVKSVFCISCPNLARTLGLRFLPKDATDFFMQVVKDTVDHREKTNHTRNDFIQLLINLKNSKISEEEGHRHDGKTLSIEELAAQSFVFFAAGFETSSTTMTFALYELAKRPDLQQKVRDEINVVLAKYNGEITYEAIQEMKYLDKVINETLRKYPPLPFITRNCVKNYKVPDQDVIIEKGTMVFIPILGIHHDKEYYPDPEKFDPERFNEENKAKRHPYSHIPFGEGPRICIGMRFGLMQSKVGLTALLRKFKFSVNEKTVEPLKMKPNSFILAAQGEIWLDAEKV